MPKILNVTPLIILLSFLLIGCNENQSTDLTQCAVVQASIECNGGYSYWINDIVARSKGVIAVSGVKDHERSSLQWVSFFSDDLSKKLAEISFPLNFYADEHNAPAILATGDGGWLVVRTGHNDTFDNGKGKLYAYSISEKFEITNETELYTDSGASYAQLVQANDKVYLLTRDTHKGWGIFTSIDNGLAWSEWQPLWKEGGRRYMSLQGFGTDDLGNDQLLLNVGHHPLDVVQKIGYLILSTSSLSASSQLNELVTNTGLSLDNEQAGSALVPLLLQSKASSSNIRFLDSSNEENNICHLYSTLDDTWQLSIVAHSVENDKKFAFNIGTYRGVLVDSTYVLGASIGHCRLNDGEQLDVFVAYQEKESNDYLIERVFIDVQSGVITSTEEIIRSKKQLYRPVYIEALDYLMFNEAEFWHRYDRWQATQKIIKLP